MDVWYFITLIGEPELWLALTGVLLVIYFLVRKRIPLKTKNFLKGVLITFILSLWLTAGITFFLKNSTSFKRPCIPCDGGQTGCNPYCPEDSSFPSGHSAIIFSVATSLFLVFRKKELLLLFPLAFIVAVSRHVLGVHYPIDIFAGALIGITVPIIVLATLRKG